MDKKIYFQAGKEHIVGEILGKHPDDPSDFVFFHGAGKSTKERARNFFDESLFNAVPSIVTFDFSGHGESSGELKESSLKQRVLEAQRAIELFTTKKDLTLCGASMGGYVALKMLPFYDVKNLILFCPAVYDKRVFEISFNQGFSEIIRKPNSWENSDIFSSLETFSGNLLLFIGKNDTVIPRGVIDLIDAHSSRAARKEIIRLDNCPHAIHSWLDSHPSEKKYIAKKIIDLYCDRW